MTDFLNQVQLSYHPIHSLFLLRHENVNFRLTNFPYESVITILYYLLYVRLRYSQYINLVEDILVNPIPSVLKDIASVSFLGYEIQ